VAVGKALLNAKTELSLNDYNGMIQLSDLGVGGGSAHTLSVLIQFPQDQCQSPTFSAMSPCSSFSFSNEIISYVMGCLDDVSIRSNISSYNLLI
jgi:hypothetical protein